MVAEYVLDPSTAMATTVVSPSRNRAENKIASRIRDALPRSFFEINFKLAGTFLSTCTR